MGPAARIQAQVNKELIEMSKKGTNHSTDPDEPKMKKSTTAEKDENADDEPELIEGDGKGGDSDEDEGSDTEGEGIDEEDEENEEEDDNYAEEDEVEEEEDEEEPPKTPKLERRKKAASAKQPPKKRMVRRGGGKGARGATKANEHVTGGSGIKGNKGYKEKGRKVQFASEVQAGEPDSEETDEDEVEVPEGEAERVQREEGGGGQDSDDAEEDEAEDDYRKESPKKSKTQKGKIPVKVKASAGKGGNIKTSAGGESIAGGKKARKSGTLALKRKGQLPSAPKMDKVEKRAKK